MKIVLIGERLINRSFNGANKALPVLASALNNAGFCNVVQLDLEQQGKRFQDVIIECTTAELIAIAGGMSVQWPEIDQTTKTIREHLTENNRSNVPIIVGGYASKNVEPIALHTPWITGYFDGEGEKGIVEIANLVNKGTFHTNRANVSGFCFVDENGVFHKTTAERVFDINSIDQNFNFSYDPLIHNMSIFKSENNTQLRTAQLYTQRGCSWNCAYCNKSREGDFVARLSKDSFSRQLRNLRADDYKAVYLDVDTFTINIKAAIEEAKILRQENFIWGTNTRVDMVDEYLINVLKKNNCTYLFFGIEQIVPEILLAIDKFSGPLKSRIKRSILYKSQVIDVFNSMNNAGMVSGFFIILGLPKAVLNSSWSDIVGYEKSTYEDDIAAIEFALNKCEPDYINLNLLRFMPGSVAADTPNHPAFECIRLSGSSPIDAAYFLPRVAKARGYQLKKNHGVYRLCESIGNYQPTTTAMTPQRVYDTFRFTLDLINTRIDSGKKRTRIFIDKELINTGLVKVDASGKYSLAPLHYFEPQ